ncbi:conjugative transposon protein TraM [Larkinella sp. GY13]|uniref:conjugative transposon protein TraM n=1 Tax=Larkinella sp. GY13 TaxID=3453720 RepID=UPI003EE82D9F
MNEETAFNEDDQTIDLDSKKKKQGQMLLILLVAVVLLVGGIILFTNSLGKKDKDSADSDLENIMPLEAKNRNDKQKEKYGIDYKRRISDENYNDGISNLTDDEGISYRRKTNENLTEADYEEVRKAANANTAAVREKRSRTTKENLNRENQRRIKAAQRRIAYDADPSTPLFKKSPEEKRQERLAELERENNARMTEAVLKGLDRASANPSANPGANPGTATGPVETKPAYSPVSAQPRPLPKKSYPGQTPPPDNSLKLNTDENTIARATSTGFYSESKSLEAEIMGQYEMIPAVVHGNGDGIRVQNGSTIKLRLLAETYIHVGNIKTVLPRNSLLNGTVRISNDRVNIVIGSVRLNNQVVPVKMLAYDIDGVQGLYIPNLMDKNLLGRELANAGSRPFQGSVWSQGSIQNQIGTQVATDVAGTLVQGGSQYARRKMGIIQVTIKPNYKVLLTAGTLENTDDSEPISNY